MRVTSKANQVTIALLSIYLIALAWILLLKLGVHFSYMENRIVNLIPFRELIMWGSIDATEIILNILIFIPLGVYLGILADDWKIKYNVLFIFLTTFLFETIQFIFRLGAFDITDVITNTLGGAIGLLLFQSSQKLVNDRNKVQRAINIIASLGTLVMISFLVLLKLNLLPIRYQ